MWFDRALYPVEPYGLERLLACIMLFWKQLYNLFGTLLSLTVSWLLVYLLCCLLLLVGHISTLLHMLNMVVI